MSKPIIDPDVYLMYFFTLRFGMTPNEIYASCRNLPGAVRPVWLGPFGSTTIPLPNATQCMDRWINITLRNSGISGHYGHSEHYTAACLADFIARHATDKIKLTWWDRFKRWLRE